jgi:hypothetical protein
VSPFADYEVDAVGKNGQGGTLAVMLKHDVALYVPGVGTPHDKKRKARIHCAAQGHS